MAWFLIPGFYSASKSIRLQLINWKVELTSSEETLSEVKIIRGFFQGDSLSCLSDMKAGYLLGEFRGKINPLLFMDDLKLYDKTMKELDSPVKTVKVFSSNIGM